MYDIVALYKPTNSQSKQHLVKVRIFLLLLVTIFYVTNDLRSQTPSDALMMEKNEFCIALIYQQDTWDEYWEGTLLRSNQNIGVLTRNTVLPMFAYGVGTKFNILASLPYVKTKAKGGQMVGASGLQDFNIFAKYSPYEWKKESGTLSTFITGGFSLPVSSYLSDYMPFSLGLGTKEFSLRGIMNYQHNSGIYLRGSYAYLHRTTTEAERDYYYSDGSFYTTTMDVPNASNVELVLGGWLFNKKLQLESVYVSQTSLSGDDVRIQNAGQPTNKMEMSSIAGRIRFFPNGFKGTSIMAGYSDVLSGRNVGKSKIISIGVTYQFMLKKS